MRNVILLLVLLLVVPGVVICPDHGKRSISTGNRRFAGKKTYCEYQHSQDNGKLHKFWVDCTN